MKTPNYIVRIPEPCHEDWNKMIPDEKGKFCGSCSKSVVDFSNKTDAEINLILLENKGQKVCGHFKKTQINRPLNISFDLKNLPKNVSSTKAFAIALFLVFGTLLFSCTDDKDQTVGTIEVTNTIQTTENEVVGKMEYLPQMITDSIEDIETVDGTMIVSESHVNGGLSYEEVTPIKDSTLNREVPIVKEEETIYRTMGLIAIETVVPVDTTTTDTIVQKNTPTQIGDNVISKNTDLSVYPNPSTGEFIIKYDVTKRADVKVDILDIKGSLIKSVVNTSNQHEGKYQIPVNLSELPSGIYFVNLTNNGKRFTEKLVITK